MLSLSKISLVLHIIEAAATLTTAAGLRRLAARVKDRGCLSATARCRSRARNVPTARLLSAPPRRDGRRTVYIRAPIRRR